MKTLISKKFVLDDQLEEIVGGNHDPDHIEGAPGTIVIVPTFTVGACSPALAAQLGEHGQSVEPCLPLDQA